MAGALCGSHTARGSRVNTQKTDIFTKIEWCVFRLTGIALLLLLAYKLLRAEISGLF